MLLVATSPTAVAPSGAPNGSVVEALATAKRNGHPVAILSNHTQPSWFRSAFGETGVQFLRVMKRQNGAILKDNTSRLKTRPHDAIVVAATGPDIQMAKNGGALLVAAGWATDPVVKELGVMVEDGHDLLEVLELTDSWEGAWWYSGYSDLVGYGVRALADLSSMYGQNADQQAFAFKVKNTVKNGGARLTALLTATARSLLAEGGFNSSDTLWGIYPSSNSNNDDTDVLCDFVHRLRTVTSRVRFAVRGEPLFIRHKPSPKRSADGGGDRTDPSAQIQTVHVNPYYRNRLKGRHVIVLDDCTTYGVSFGVAAGFLRRAGASRVTGLALGKFGSCLSGYHIIINADPFAPVKAGRYENANPVQFLGTNDPVAKVGLRNLIP